MWWKIWKLNKNSYLQNPFDSQTLIDRVNLKIVNSDEKAQIQLDPLLIQWSSNMGNPFHMLKQSKLLKRFKNTQILEKNWTASMNALTESKQQLSIITKVNLKSKQWMTSFQFLFTWSVNLKSVTLFLRSIFVKIS